MLNPISVFRIHCRIDEQADLSNSEHRPFSLPNADSIMLYDFYCSRQYPLHDGIETLREAGVDLKNKLPTGVNDDFPIAEDTSNDGSEYLIVASQEFKV